MKRADNLAQAPEYRGRQQLIDQWEQLLNVVLADDACFSLKQLAVKGNDLTNFGLSGPRVGTVLNCLLDLVVDGELPNDRDILLEYTKEALL